MVNRDLCEEAYKVIGKPKDPKELRSFFNTVEKQYKVEHKQCINDVSKTSQAREGLLEECHDSLDQAMSGLREADSFLKKYQSICATNIQCADSYAALELRGGDNQVINKQYRKLSKTYHPDLCKEKDEVCREVQDKISAAKQFLLDENNHCTEINGLEDFFVSNVVGSDLQPQPLQEL